MPVDNSQCLTELVDLGSQGGKVSIPRRCLGCLPVSIVFVCLIAALPSPSQVKQSSPNLWGTTNNKSTNPIQPLKEAPQLPQLPGYSGKAKFLRGYVQATDKGWTIYQINYLTKEDLHQVKDWYQNALDNYQWKTLGKTSQTITANYKDSHMCTIIVNSTSEPGYRSQFEVLYSVAPKIPESN